MDTRAYLEQTLRTDIAKLEEERAYVQDRLHAKRTELAKLIWQGQQERQLTLLEVDGHEE